MFSAPDVGRTVVLSIANEPQPPPPQATPRRVVLPSRSASVRPEAATPLSKSVVSRNRRVTLGAAPTGDASSRDAVRWVDVFDLCSGRRRGRIEVPPVSELADVSPDGKLMVIIGPDRLDVWSLEKSHVIAGFSFAERSTEKIHWAKLLDESHVATLGPRGS